MYNKIGNVIALKPLLLNFHHLTFFIIIDRCDDSFIKEIHHFQLLGSELVSIWSPVKIIYIIYI